MRKIKIKPRRPKERSEDLVERNLSGIDFDAVSKDVRQQLRLVLLQRLYGEKLNRALFEDNDLDPYFDNINERIASSDLVERLLGPKLFRYFQNHVLQLDQAFFDELKIKVLDLKELIKHPDGTSKVQIYNYLTTHYRPEIFPKLWENVQLTQSDVLKRILSGVLSAITVLMGFPIGKAMFQAALNSENPTMYTLAFVFFMFAYCAAIAGLAVNALPRSKKEGGVRLAVLNNFLDGGDFVDDSDGGIQVLASLIIRYERELAACGDNIYDSNVQSTLSDIRARFSNYYMVQDEAVDEEGDGLPDGEDAFAVEEEAFTVDAQKGDEVGEFEEAEESRQGIAAEEEIVELASVEVQ